MSDPASEAEEPRPAAPVEIPIDGVGTVRGLHWPDAGTGRAVIFLHAPDGDLDDWQDLPAFVAGSAGCAALALDLPGHGLSDDPMSAWSISRLLAAAGDLLGLPPSRCAIVAAGETAARVVSLDPAPPLAGLIAIGPTEPESAPRSPGLPKLFLASATDPDRLQATRALANGLGGWAIVSAITPGEQDPWLLSGPWGTHVREQIAAFARDCLTRPVR